MDIPPSKKVTVPLGVGATAIAGDTVAVKVIGWPNVLAAVELKEVVVSVCACAALSNKNSVAQASAIAPIARRSFGPARNAQNTVALSARTNAAHLIFQAFTNDAAPPTSPCTAANDFISERRRAC
jgi:hypothetical protein